jgi:hypothetical protein
MSDDFDFGNLSSDEYKHWGVGDKKFFAVKLEGLIKTSFNASGGVKFTGITGNVSKDNQVATDWLVLVKHGDQKVQTISSWEYNDQANYLAKVTGGPVNAIFKTQPDNVNPTEGSQ